MKGTIMRKLLPILLLCLLLTACAREAPAPRSGVYRMSAPPETLNVPSLALDAETSFFAFSYDTLSSYLPYGSYAYDASTLVCTTDDGLYTYLFRRVNETTLAFIADGSADMTLIDESFGQQVLEGSVFLLDN